MAQPTVGRTEGDTLPYKEVPVGQRRSSYLSQVRMRSVTSSSLGLRTSPTTSSVDPHLGPSRLEASLVPTRSGTSQKH